VLWFPLFVEIISIQQYFVYFILSGCFFHPDNLSSITYQVQIGKVVEKIDFEK
tara:strand:- start:227 stop:385 length:159 start_codon:yes stop_codon:yes gene_type:complete